MDPNTLPDPYSIPMDPADIQWPTIDPHLLTSEVAVFLALAFCVGLAIYELFKILPKSWQ